MGSESGWKIEYFLSQYTNNLWWVLFEILFIGQNSISVESISITNWI